MATYIVKLVDHADYTEQQKNSVSIKVQEIFDKAFVGDPNDVNVVWGSGNQSDNYVVHFVPDVDNSYLKQTWPDANIDPDAGGHTHTHGSLAGTEIYRKRKGRQFHPKGLAVTAFHESMHNLYPYQTVDFVHRLDGGGKAAGLAAAHYGDDTPMTKRNKELVRAGLAVKNPQLL